MNEKVHKMSLFSLTEGKAEGKTEGKAASVRRAKKIIDATQSVSPDGAGS
jgi:hypothetical protein